jgi:hypothetical protein
MTELQKRKQEKYKKRKKTKTAKNENTTQTSVGTSNHYYDTSDGNISIYDQSSGITTVRHYKNNR